MKHSIKSRIEQINAGQVPAGYKKTKFGIIPSEWDIVPFDKIMQQQVRRVAKPTEAYWRLGLRSHGKGTFHELVEDPSTVDMEELFVVKENDLIFNITFAWEHAVALAGKNDEDRLVSHRFPTYTFINGNESSFYKHVVFRKWFKEMLKLISPGGAGRNRVMSKKLLLKELCYAPKPQEQQEMARVLNEWDRAISIQERLIVRLEERKVELRNNIINRNAPFEWREYQISELLTYSRPDKYIVDPTDEGDIPVLTANKALVLGYADTEKYCTDVPAIIFDDFTLNNKYVDFPFSVRSSAIKILHPQKDVSLKYVFEAMQLIKYFATDHRRYYISEMQHFRILYPVKKTDLESIVMMFFTLDNEIDISRQKLEKMKLQKQALMQLLLTGIVRVEV